MKKSLLPFIFYALIIVMPSCTNNESIFTIGSGFLESKTNIIMVDTFQVELSTVLLDSLPTSLVDTILIGNYKDDLFGHIHCNGYFEFGLPSGTNVENNDIYDSITLQLQYTGYSFGDTLQDLAFQIHLLSERIQLHESGFLYNTSGFSCEEIPLASCSFTPKPNGADSAIEFRLHDDFGTELFNKMKNNDDLMASESEFITHYKGMALISDTTASSSVVSFLSSDEDIKIKLYTHRISAELKEIEYDFPLVNSDKQFSSIKHDYHNTPLENLKTQSENIPSAEMNDKAYVQGGVGIMTKINFPTMNEFLYIDNSFILKAELIIKPAAGSYNVISLPEYVYLYNTDKNNNLGYILYDESGYKVSPYFSLDEFYHDDTYYQYDLTKFLKDELSDDYYDPEHGLLVTFSDANYICSLDRIVFDDSKNKSRLKIYYVKY